MSLKRCQGLVTSNACSWHNACILGLSLVSPLAKAMQDRRVNHCTGTWQQCYGDQQQQHSSSIPCTRIKSTHSNRCVETSIASDNRIIKEKFPYTCIASSIHGACRRTLSTTQASLSRSNQQSNFTTCHPSLDLSVYIASIIPTPCIIACIISSSSSSVVVS